MKRFQIILLTAILALFLQLVFPWWIVAVGAFIISLFYTQSGWQAYLNGFLGIFTLWLIWSASISYLNGGVLSARLSDLLMLPYSWMAILWTAIIGGLCGGFAALTANKLHRVIKSG
jgi:FtsH-binding integral membrane protein